jgi:hypothetical protein
MANALATLQQRKIRLHFICVLVTALPPSLAGPEDDFMQLQRRLTPGVGKPFTWGIRQALWTKTRAGLE